MPSFNWELAPRVVIVGAGGLGIPAAWGLVTGWNLGLPLLVNIVDYDTVALSNLHRQVLFHESDIGKPKASTLSERLNLLGHKKSSIRVSSEELRLEANTAERILDTASLVIDCTDSIPTKFLISDYCSKRAIPFCYAGVIGSHGLVILSAPYPGRPQICLRCIFAEADPENNETGEASCRAGGVLGPVAGTIGLLQAEQALRLLKGVLLGPQLLRFSLLDAQIRSSTICLGTCCEHKVHKLLDLRSEVCPSTFLYTKLALQSLPPGTSIEASYSAEKSAVNVYRTLKEEGYSPRSLGWQDAKQAWGLLLTNHSNGPLDK